MDISTYWLSLKDPKDTNPIELADCVILNKLTEWNLLFHIIQFLPSEEIKLISTAKSQVKILVFGTFVQNWSNNNCQNREHMENTIGIDYWETAIKHQEGDIEGKSGIANDNIHF